MTRRRLLLVPLGLLALLPACAAASAAPTRVTTVRLTAHHSHWSKQHIVVRRGATVRIVVRNTDPIDHELIVGDQAVQDRHERGTEAKHPPRPGEVSVPAGATVETTIQVDRPGTLLFGCHLPGHWDYGMRGTITVTP